MFYNYSSKQDCVINPAVVVSKNISRKMEIFKNHFSVLYGVLGLHGGCKDPNLCSSALRIIRKKELLGLIN